MASGDAAIFGVNGIGGSGVGGRTQIINGQPYEMYSPQWYAARDAQKVQQAGVAGTAAGTAVKNFKDTTGSTSGFGPGSTSSSSGSSTYTPIPRVGSSTTTSGASGPGGQAGSGSSPDVAAINAQAQAAQDAALGRAKENAGLISRSALTGLQEAMGERQMLGSGAEAQATGDVAMKGAGLINDVNVAGLNKQSDLAQRLAELSYTGRGQDINRELGHLSADVTQRGQDISAQTTMRGQDFSREAAQAGQYYNETAQLLAALKNLVY